MSEFDTAPVVIDGVKHELPYKLLTRGGSSSPRTELFLYDGRWITPYEQRLKGWKYSFGTLLEFYLPKSLLREEMLKESFLRNIPAQDSWQGGFITIPFPTYSWWEIQKIKWPRRLRRVKVWWRYLTWRMA